MQQNFNRCAKNDDQASNRDSQVIDLNLDPDPHEIGLEIDLNLQEIDPDLQNQHLYKIEVIGQQSLVFVLQKSITKYVLIVRHALFAMV